MVIQDAVTPMGAHMPPSKRLIERINRNGPVDDFSTPRPVVTLEEFFEGMTTPVRSS
jgi:hypothetical protein